jgi:hypothetical protein
VKRTLAFLLSLLFLLSLVGCPASDAPPTVLGNTMIPADAAVSSLFCRETSIIYKRAEFGEYLPGSLSKNVYATAVLEGGGTLSFYKIKDANPHEYLFQADPYDNYPTYLLYASTLTLPTLTELAVSDILICDASADFFWRDANVIDRIRMYDRVRDIVRAYEDGEKLTERPLGATVLSCELIFVSAEYKFNAVVGLEQLEDGTILLSTSRGTVAVDANLFEGYPLKWES